MYSFIILAVAASIAASSVVQTPEATDGSLELIILHNNDMHARFEQTSQLSGVCTTADREAGKCYGGFARVATVVKKAREEAASGQGPPVLYLNAGDTYSGSAWFTLYKWKIAAEFVNALKPDAVSLGNHEFDKGVDGLLPFIHNLSCPVLSSNLILDKEPELQKEKNLMKSTIFTIKDVKIGVIGYLTPDTKLIAVPNNVEYIDEIVALKQEVAELTKQDVKIIIALGHSGLTKDIEIAKEVEGIDLIVGGHSHTFLWNGTAPDTEIPLSTYPTYVQQKSGKTIPVVQAYAFTKYFGKMHLIFDAEGEITFAEGTPIVLDDSIPKDPEVQKIIERYQAESSSLVDEVVGSTSVLLDGHTCRRKECNLGNLIADAMINEYSSKYKGDHWTDTPVAIIQGGGVRASIHHENMTKGDLLTVLPFEGNLVVVKMSGGILMEMLEHSVANYDALDDPGEFLQFSGIKVVYDLKKPPGSRVYSAVVRCDNCSVPEYNKLNISKVYKVIMPGFVSEGGDGYVMLKSQPKQNLPYNELFATLQYLRTHSPVMPEIYGRIIFKSDQGSNVGTAKIPLVQLLLCSLFYVWLAQ